MAILEAPKIYFDTSHLIRLANYRSGEHSVRADTASAYRLLDQSIRERHFGLIFAPISALEWVDGNATLESALEIAAVIDSAALQYEFEGDTFVYLHEVLDQLQAQNHCLVLPKFDVFFVRDIGAKCERAITVLMDMVPEFFDPGDLTPEAEKGLPREIPFSTAADEARAAWRFKHHRPRIYEERVRGYKAAYSKERTSVLASKSGKQDVITWLKSFLKVDRILSKLNPGIDVDEELASLNLSDCPALSLYLAAVNQRTRAGIKPRDNDVDDWMSVPVIPYADIVLTERNLRHFVCQADSSLSDKVTHDPNEAVKFLRPWLPEEIRV